MKILKARLYELELSEAAREARRRRGGEEGDRLRQPDPLLRAAPLPDGQGPPHQARDRQPRPRAGRRPRRLHQGDARGEGEGHARPGRRGGRGLAGPQSHAQVPCRGRLLLLRRGVLRRAAARTGKPKPRPAPVSGDAAASRFELVFEREVAGNLDLYLIPAGGGPERRLTDTPGEDGLARFSPDGERILFTSLRTGNYQLYEVPAAGGAGAPPPHERRDRVPGGLLARRPAARVPVEPRRPRAAAGPGPGERRRCASWCATARARSSATRTGARTDGCITFSSNFRIGHQIYVVDVASGEVRRLSPITSGGCEPHFSRDGLKVVYVSRRHLGSESRLVEHELATRRRSERSSPGPPSTTTPSTRRTAASSPSPRTSPASTRSTASGSSDGRAWRVTFGPGPARYPDYRPLR